MNNQTSILTDIALDAVVGGSMITEMAAAAVKGAASGATGSAAPNFGVAFPTSGNGGGRCNSNHNGVHY
jgi:hypothetical protein